MLKESSSFSSQIIDLYDLLSENNDTEQSADDQTKSLFSLNNCMSDVTSDNNKLLEIQMRL